MRLFILLLEVIFIIAILFSDMELAFKIMLVLSWGATLLTVY